jgi:hypothetical protein
MQMAFSTKGWRRIAIRDQVYFWQGDDEREHFNVRPEQEPYRLLTVTCDRCGQHVGGFFRGVKPGIVRSAIEFALNEAWLEGRPQMHLIVFDVSLRFVTIRPSWLTSTVLQLAHGIDEDQAFDRMPILADALQDAGCENADILGHCRSEGPHGQGCWVVDLLLQKE